MKFTSTLEKGFAVQIPFSLHELHSMLSRSTPFVMFQGQEITRGILHKIVCLKGSIIIEVEIIPVGIIMTFESEGPI